jgi:hypothetical protein
LASVIGEVPDRPPAEGVAATIEHFRRAFDAGLLAAAAD